MSIMHRSRQFVLTATLCACGPQVALDEGETGDAGDHTATTHASAEATGPTPQLDTSDVDGDDDGDGTIPDDIRLEPGCIDGPPGVCLDPGPIVPIEIVPLQVAAGDLDGDGIDEIIVSGENEPSLLVARLFDDELVLEPHDLPTSAQVPVTVGDLDGDGRDDIAVAVFDPPAILVGYGPDLTPSIATTPAQWPWSVTFAENDTGPALLFTSAGANWPEHAALAVLRPFGPGAFQVVGGEVDLGEAPWGAIYAGHVAALPRGPGYACASVIVKHYESAPIAELRMDVALGSDTPVGTVAPLDEGVYAMVVGDVDGDDEPDLFLAGNAGIRRLGVQGSIRPVASLGPLGVHALAIGDFDGDGIDDLAAGIEDAGEIWVGVAWADTPAAEGSLPSGLFPLALAVGDFDGNGRDDLVAVDQAGLLAVWLSGP